MIERASRHSRRTKQSFRRSAPRKSHGLAALGLRLCRTAAALALALLSAPPAVLALALLSAPPAVLAVSGVHPSGVNVNGNGVTSVFLTFQNLGPNERALESFWCSDVTATGVTSFDPCVPGTILGRLPQRNDLSRPSGTGGFRNFTDVMTIPASVARRAFQDAQRGNPSDFFYVRRFTDGVNDTYVTVTCRMTGGGARVPLALTDVRIAFNTPEGERPVHFVGRDEPLPSFGARIRYNGAGRLKGRWELVNPGDVVPSFEDLLTEASLPVEQRGLQRRYSLIERFDVLLPPSGTFYLQGPDPDKVPVGSDGPYQIVLRVEASDEKEGDSDTLAGIVPSGGVAGFPMPLLRFFVGSPEILAAAQEEAAVGELRLMLPGAGAEVPQGVPVSFSWIVPPGAALLELEVAMRDGEGFSAVVPAARSAYTAPPWAAAASGAARWRVTALDRDGNRVARSRWRDLSIAGDPEAEPGER